MATGSANIALNVTGNANQQLAKTQAQVASLGKSFNKMGTELAGINSMFGKLNGILGVSAVLAFGAASLKAADEVSDLSDAVGVSIAQIKGLQQAFQASGGDAEGATTAYTRLSKAVSEARQGNEGLRAKMEELGITQEMLKRNNLSEIMTQTLTGMQNLGASTDKTALSMELLGKSNRSLNFEKVNSDLAENKKMMQDIAPYIKAQGDLYDNLSKIGAQFSNEMTKSTGGLIQMFADLTTNTKQIAESLAQLTKILGLALATWLLFSKVLPLVTGSMNGLQTVLTGTGSIVQSTSRNLTQLWGNLTRVVSGTGKIVTAAGAAVTTFTVLSQRLFSLAGAFAAILRIGIRFAGLATMIITVAQAFDFFVDKILGMGSPLDWLGEKLSGLWEGFKKLTGMAPSLPNIERGRPTMANDPRRTDAPTAGPIVDTNLKLKKSIDDITASYREQAFIRASALHDEFRFMGMSENAVELEKAKTQILQHQKDALKDLESKEQEIINDNERSKESKKTLLGVIEQQRQAVNIVAQAETTSTEMAIANIQKRRLEQVKLNNTLEITKVAMDNQQALKNLSDQISLIGLYGDALDTATMQLQVQQELDSKLLDIDKQRLDLLKIKTTLTADQYAEESSKLDRLTKQANIYADARVAGETKVANARKVSDRTDVPAAIGKRMEELQRSIDPTVLAVQELDSVFGNMGKAIDNFVDTGKFAFSDFASSVIKDLLKIELKAAATKMFTSMGGLGGILGGIGSWLGGFFAEGGSPPVNKPSIVGENGPELFVPKSAGTVIPNGMGGGQPVVNNYITNNNVSAIDAKSVAQFFAENRKTMLGSVELARKELPYGNR